MELFNRPLYQFLQKEMQQRPEQDQRWKSIVDRGYQTAEVANLVAMRKQDPRWHQLTANLQEAGLQLAEAAKSQDWQATQQAYTRSSVGATTAIRRWHRSGHHS